MFRNVGWFVLLVCVVLGVPSVSAQEIVVVDQTQSTSVGSEVPTIMCIDMVVDSSAIPLFSSSVNVVASIDMDPESPNFGVDVSVCLSGDDDPEPPYTLPDPAPENPENPVKPDRTPEEEKQAQKEHDEYKELEKVPDAEKNEKDECKKLKMELARKRKLITARQAWDDKWFPGRHAGDIYRLKKNYNKIYEKWKKACGDKNCSCACDDCEPVAKEEIPEEAISVLESISEE